MSKQLSINSDTIYYQTLELNYLDGFPSIVTNEVINPQLPKQFSILNYPNPFNPATKISYELPALRGGQVTNYVSLKVYDLLGKEVANLVNQKQNAGRYSVIFDGSKFSSGIYFYRLETNGIDITRRMLLIK